MGSHAILSASGAHRWLNCLPSARLELEFENKETTVAAEGSAAHALCEHKLRKALRLRSKRPISNYDSDDMEEYTDSYVDFVMEQLEIAKQTCKDPLVLIEQKLDFSCYVPQGFGTGDCIIIADEKLHIIDFKYGMGVLVDAVDNPQMKLYALGALEIYDSLYDIKEVSMTIFQPRRENISTWTVSVEDLKGWAENELKPKAQMAINGEGEYLSGEWCCFCKAKDVCRARAEYNLDLAKHEFKMPPLLTDIEVEDILSRVDDLVAWASSIKEYALQAALNGKHWNGWKVCEGRSNRKYSDENAVVDIVKTAGFDPYEHKILGITAMQKLLGKKKFDELIGDLVYKPLGKPVLVPISDKRPAINTATNDFIEVLE